MDISDLNGEKIIGTFYEKELQKTNQQQLKKGKVTKWKGDKFYFKWKGYHNSFNSWIDKKDLVGFYCIKNEPIFPSTVWTIWWGY